MNLVTALWVALAGAAGTLCRYAVALWMTRWTSGRVPWPTFAVNLLGAMIIGYVAVRFAARADGGRLRAIVATGFLGGFTTYSAFALETVELLERRQLGLAALYVGGTFALAAAGCWLGMSLARAGQ